MPRARPLILALAVALIFTGCSRPSGSDEKVADVWLETGVGPGQTVYPRAIAYDPANDWFFLVDRQARVQRLAGDGQYLSSWTMPDFQQGKPVGLSVGPDGLLYVPDTHYHRVVVYTPEGKELRRWGRKGSAPGEFIYPTDIAFDGGKVFVTEYGDHDRVQVFTPEGKFLYEFGEFGHGPSQFSRPQSMVIKDGEVFITDSCNHRVQVFSTDGTFRRTLGEPGGNPGQFRFPYGLDLDPAGNLLVTEFGNNRIQSITRDGKPLKTWGTPGKGNAGLAFPWASAVDKRGRVVIVDSGNNRLQVLKF